MRPNMQSLIDSGDGVKISRLALRIEKSEIPSTVIITNKALLIMYGLRYTVQIFEDGNVKSEIGNVLVENSNQNIIQEILHLHDDDDIIVDFNNFLVKELGYSHTFFEIVDCYEKSIGGNKHFINRIYEENNFGLVIIEETRREYENIPIPTSKRAFIGLMSCLGLKDLEYNLVPSKQ